MTRMLRGLFFDFDGTIAETERVGHRVAYNRAFGDLGVDWSWDEQLYGDLLSVAGGKERLRYYLTKYRPGLLNDAIASGLIADIHRAKIRHFATIAPTIPLRPGVMRLMREAHAVGVAIVIATTASKPGVEALLRQHEALPAIVDMIAANEAVERKKPAPDIYLWALEQMGLAAAECVAIEDSNVGLRAALAAHVQTIITVSDYTVEDNFAGASAVLSDLGESGAPAVALNGPGPKGGIVDLTFLRTMLHPAQVIGAA
jgi:HAD superfamily hydrolase (TIGR01509 family)